MHFNVTPVTLFTNYYFFYKLIKYHPLHFTHT